ncbi:hypothetical protein GGG17_01195 [Arsenicicoccus sp. MKL-02]|uniref:Uncharacterized protein n=1 Tax=Arsenicicoccus cauae TaxID=2663847 RepID=A0A6I3I9P5_9MICO|nr:hypothetical protein [Arsenicicoccus cauae]MTB70612.1 hypothetical protein [Arsenicicoccus cauae]
MRDPFFAVTAISTVTLRALADRCSGAEVRCAQRPYAAPGGVTFATSGRPGPP